MLCDTKQTHKQKYFLPGTCGWHELPRIWPHTPGRLSIAPEPLHPGVGVQAEHSLGSYRQNTHRRVLSKLNKGIDFMHHHVYSFIVVWNIHKDTKHFLPLCLPVKSQFETPNFISNIKWLIIFLVVIICACQIKVWTV